MTTTNAPGLTDEPQALAEWLRLAADPLFYGAGVPRGDGRIVLVLPGLFGNDLYLQPLRTWLRRIGYRPLRSGLAFNAGCSERLTRQIERDLATARGASAAPVAILGHSRGGILGRVIAARLQDQASHLITLGSPIGATAQFAATGVQAPNTASQLVVDASLRVRQILDPDCNFPDCGCPFPTDIRIPLAAGTHVVAIYSRDDRVVSPAACPIAGAHNVEVGGTHSGLVYNRAVYREIASALAGR